MKRSSVGTFVTLAALCAACGDSDTMASPSANGGQTGGAGGSGGNVGAGGNDIGGRSADEICSLWTDGHVRTSMQDWSGTTGQCDSGVMSTEAIDDSMRRVNMFREFLELEPVTYDASEHDTWMRCALIMGANGTDHYPPPSSTCYDALGAQAAANSNIGVGLGRAAAYIDAYVYDAGVASLGHRLYLLHPRLSAVQIGYSEGGFSPGHCIGIRDQNGSYTKPWTAYPNPGHAPHELAPASAIAWSFHSHALTFTAATTVTMEDADTGDALPVDVEVMPAFGELSVVKWHPDGWQPTADTSYRVTVTATSDGDITYVTRLVDCEQ